jgi:hypothetical protein
MFSACIILVDLEKSRVAPPEKGPFDLPASLCYHVYHPSKDFRGCRDVSGLSVK